MEGHMAFDIPHGPKVLDCDYEVYRVVFERVTALVQAADDYELSELEPKLNTLTGGARAAAILARMDALGGGPSRDKQTVCVTICDAPCEEHPRSPGLRALGHVRQGGVRRVIRFD
jgi:hypothetical protein